jgi:hypothetical protein
LQVARAKSWPRPAHHAKLNFDAVFDVVVCAGLKSFPRILAALFLLSAFQKVRARQAGQ